MNAHPVSALSATESKLVANLHAVAGQLDAVATTAVEHALGRVRLAAANAKERIARAADLAAVIVDDVLGDLHAVTGILGDGLAYNSRVQVAPPAPPAPQIAATQAAPEQHTPPARLRIAPTPDGLSPAEPIPAADPNDASAIDLAERTEEDIDRQEIDAVQRMIDDERDAGAAVLPSPWVPPLVRAVREAAAEEPPAGAGGQVVLHVAPAIAEGVHTVDALPQKGICLANTPAAPPQETADDDQQHHPRIAAHDADDAPDAPATAKEMFTVPGSADGVFTTSAANAPARDDRRTHAAAGKPRATRKPRGGKRRP
jgi:hypothetical protein